eukprot:m.204869 g.204869  ORF g.204869 m.204869 type:complete len:65 (-) comp26039_c0_seq6:10634-10828(-)
MDRAGGEKERKQEGKKERNESKFSSTAVAGKQMYNQCAFDTPYKQREARLMGTKNQKKPPRRTR